MVSDHRVGHAERTQVLGLLGNAYEAGVLPVGDYDARVAAVSAATYASELSLQVSDLGSTNGTYLNGEQQPLTGGQTRALKDGDQVHVGAWTTITLHAPGS